ncbi:MAG: DsbA family protein [Pseudomonadota bacterium]
MKHFAHAIALVALVAAGCGGETQTASADETASPATEASVDGSVERSAYETATDMAIGDPAAPVTIIEYASVTCSHCATFHSSTFKDLKAKYVDTGKVRFVFREFPTAPAPLSAAGFLLARCVGDERGAKGYFAVIDALFKRQADWAFGKDPRGELLKIAAEAGVDEPEFEACIRDEDNIAQLRETAATAQQEFKIAATPSFVMNGEPLSARTIEQFDEAIAPLLPAE